MKKIFTLMLVAAALTTQACEICGCGVGNFYLGMMPHYNNQFVGLRYRYMSFSSKPHEDQSEFSHDNYRSLELWGGFKLGKKWQALVLAPYQINQRITNEKSLQTSGLGDITVLANYRLFNSAMKNGNQQIWIGGGLKLPTGNYQVNFSDPDTNLGDPNVQTGSGSLDYLLNINHNLSIGNWGLNTTANYKINTSNQDNFRFGNRFTLTMLAYHRWQVKGVNIAPLAGVMVESSAANQYQNMQVEMTGGGALFANAGIELSVKKVAIGYSAQLPTLQNLSQNQTTAKLRWLIHCTIVL